MACDDGSNTTLVVLRGSVDGRVAERKTVCHGRRELFVLKIARLSEGRQGACCVCATLVPLQLYATWGVGSGL